MRESNFNYFGIGIYTVPEASRLSGVSSQRIRRWLKGYSFPTQTGVKFSPSVWIPQLPQIDGKLALSFRDLIEVRFVEAFLQEGVNWKSIRTASLKAMDWFKTSHPFSTRRFSTDGKTIFTELIREAKDEALIDLVSDQYAFKKLLAPILKGLEFDNNYQTIRWWPLGERRRVVLDPNRSFGQPIVSVEGVPTAILAKAFEVEKSINKVCRWYEVSKESIRDAIEFEKRLAA
jgi:uncharacterized protein (DUF433 family)